MLRSSKSLRKYLLLLLILALAVRTFRAWQEPVINGDAVRFIQQAKLMSIDPLAAMRTEIYHPLHSALSLLAHTAIAPLFSDDRIAWIWSLKIVGILAGSVVALQIVQLGRLLGAPFWFAFAASLVWIFGRRTSYYGADAISDTLALSLFAGSMILALHALRHHGRFSRSSFRQLTIPFFFAGILSGLSYLARPEGLLAALLISILLLRSLWIAGPRLLWRRVASSVSALILGTALPALQYMLAINSLTQKETKLISGAPAFDPNARSITLAGVPAKILQELWETFGFGPFLIVVITFAASLLLVRHVWVRRRLRFAIALWMISWILIMAYVTRKLGYLDGRHTLILILPLHALLALAFFAIHQAVRFWAPARLRKHAATWAITFVILAILPGAILLSSTPREDQAYVCDAAAWIKNNTPPETLVCDYELVAGFYAHREVIRWVGTPTDPRLPELESQLPPGRPVLLAYRFLRDTTPAPAIGPYLAVKSFPSPTHETLTFYRKPDPPQ